MPDSHIARIAAVERAKGLRHVRGTADRVRRDLGLPSRMSETVSRISEVFASVGRTFRLLSAAMPPPPPVAIRVTAHEATPNRRTKETPDA